MSLHELGTIISLITGVFSVIGVIWAFVGKLARLDLQVQTMWAFQLRRGFGEALDKGLMARNSPITITAEAKALFEPMREDLQKYYHDFCIKMSMGELALALERQFGRRMVNEICIPAKLTESACLLIAIAVAKKEDTIHMSDAFPGSAGHVVLKVIIDKPPTAI